MEAKRVRLLSPMAALGAAALAVGLLTGSQAVSEGVRRGLAVCGGVLIPSLFPFMALSGFISITECGRILSIPLRAVTTRILKLPQELGYVVLLSLIGGYPVGAKMIAGLLEDGGIDRKTAERMLCFCVGSGPSFLITAVGAELFLDRTAGVILFAAQTAATLIIGWAVSLRVPRPSAAAAPPVRAGGAAALVLAVNGAASAMLVMCAFAILFSGLLSMVSESGVSAWVSSFLGIREPVVTAALSGLFEVTAGCVAAAKAGGLLSFGMASAMVSFGGLSVLFQVMSCFGGQAFDFRPYLASRAAHMGLSTAMAVPLYRLFCPPRPVWLAARPTLAGVDGRTVLMSVCLLAMCTIFMLQLGDIRSETGK